MDNVQQDLENLQHDLAHLRQAKAQTTNFWKRAELAALEEELLMFITIAERIKQKEQEGK